MKSILAVLFAIGLANYCLAGTPLTNAAEVARSVAAQRHLGEKFDLTAQVIIAQTHDTAKTLTVKDDSGFIRISLPDDPNATAKPGDRVQLQGTIYLATEDALFAYATNLTVIGHAEVPPPVDATYDDIYSGKLAYGIVRLHGIVVDVFRDEADSRFSFLILSVDGRPIGLPSCNIPYERLARLVGAEIAVVGTCSAYCGHGPRSKLEYEVYIERESDIAVITPPPADPFDVSEFEGGVYPIIFPKPGDSMRRKVVGKVEATTDERNVYVRTPNGSISVVRLTTESLPPAPGDTIETVGIAETDFYSMNLSRAIWRPAAAPVEIAEVTAETKSIKDIFFDPRRSSRFNNELIGHVLRVCGTVVTINRMSDGRGLILLNDEGNNISADASTVRNALDAIEPGCKVEITGLCVAEAENWRPQSPFPHISKMSLIIRTPGDIVILARPPWWTPSRLRLAILILLGVILVFFFYSIFLTRIIRRRNEDLNHERQIHERTEIRRFERTRLAIELHDSIVQILTGTAMEVDTACKIGVSDPDAMASHLRIAEKALQSCREELRNSIWDLRSDALEEDTVEKSILRTLTPHVNKARVAVKFAVPREILSDNTCHAVIKIIRELTVNATNHGHARLVRIAGKAEDGVLYFSVIDDGTGFDVDNRPGVIEGHFGLQGVKERVIALGGTFTLTSAPGRGTKAWVTIPLETELI